MAGETTGIVTISHRDIHSELRGAVGSRLWRLGYVAALIEKHEATWVVSAAGHGAGRNPSQLVIARFDQNRPVIEALIVGALGLFGLPPKVASLAAYEDVLHEQQGIRYIAPRTVVTGIESGEEIPQIRQASEGLNMVCVEEAAKVMRLGVAALPSSLLISQASVRWLRGYGFDVDEFAYRPG